MVLAIVAFAATSVAAELVEAIVARVGDRIVTRSQYVRRLQAGLEEIDRTVPAEQRTARKEAYRRALLEDMISELLIKDRADRLNITVSDAEVKEAIGRLKAQYGISSDEEFEASLQASGLNRREMEARLRETLLTNKVFGRELRSRDDLTDAELRERYEREKEAYRRPERARVREIIVLVPEGADDAAKRAAQARAAEAARRAQAGEAFATLVAQYSDSPTKERDGDLGEITVGELVPALDSGVFASDAGAIVGPVETRFGYHILMVEERLPSQIPSFDAVKERMRKEAGDETFERDLKAYLERLRGEAYVQVMEQNLPAATPWS